MNKLFLFAFFVVAFYACSKSDSSGDSFLKKATVKDASAIYLSNENSGRATTEEVRRYMTIDSKGMVKPIRFITEKGDTVDMHIDKIRNLNAQYLLMQGTFKFNEDVYFHYLFVNKKTEAIYALKFTDYSGYYIDNEGLTFTDDDQNIYTELFGNIYKFDVSNPDMITFEQYLPYEQYPSQSQGFEVSKNGLLYYKPSNGEIKFKCPGGRIYSIQELVQQELNLDPEKYININPFIVEETFYASVRYDNNNKDINCLIRFNLENKNSLKVEIRQEFSQESSIYGLTYNSVRAIYEGVHLSENIIWDYDPQENTFIKTDYTFPSGSEIGRSSVSLWVSPYSGSGKTYASYRLRDYTKGCEVDLKSYGIDEVYSSTCNSAQEGLTFSGFRYSDGKNVIGKIEENGNVIINEDTKSSSKITTLLLLN